METTQVTNEVPEVHTALSTSFTSNTVHVAKTQNGHTFAACNGRTSFSGGMAPATEVTCKRCRKLVTC